MPITKMLTNLFTVDEETLSTEQVSEQLHDSRVRMSEGFSQLLNTGSKTTNKAESVSNWVSRAFAAYEGLRIGISIVRAFGNIFGRKRRR